MNLRQQMQMHDGGRGASRASPRCSERGTPQYSDRLLAALLLIGVMAGSPAVAEGQETAFFPVESIRPGLEGVALTVFEGEEVEEFRVEFLGVLKNAIGPQQDMILARLHGENVEFTGVVSGMSGSPVYVDGRLVGAISYRLGQFGKEPIAGITPIADMLKVASAGDSTAPRKGGRAPDLIGRFLGSGTIPGLGDAPVNGVDGPPETNVPTVTTSLGGMQPISTPPVCSGCDPGVLGYYAPIFRRQGLEPTAGGGMADVETPLPLLPGTGIGGALVTGDLSVAGIGTLTYVDGDTVIGFGHPFLGTGSIEIPMTQAQVLLTFASSQASFRVANSTAPIGTLVEDRLTAIVGELGRTAPMLPLTVRVGTAGGERTFHYDVVRDRSWAPVMVSLITANSLVRTTEYTAGATLALRYRIDLEGLPSVSREDLYSGVNPNQPVHLSLANNAGSLFSVLINNPFEAVTIKAAEIDVDVLEESQIARVAGLRASRNAVKPGEPFIVTATLAPFRGEEREVEFEVRLPEDIKRGEVTLYVGAAGAVNALDRKVFQQQVRQAKSIDDLIGLIDQQRRNRSLYLHVSRPTPLAVVRSEVLPDLPISVFTVLNNPRYSADTSLMIGTPILELSTDLDLVAVGGRRIRLKVK